MRILEHVESRFLAFKARHGQGCRRFHFHVKHLNSPDQAPPTSATTTNTETFSSISVNCFSCLTLFGQWFAPCSINSRNRSEQMNIYFQFFGD